MTNLLTNGIGGTVGDILATCKPLYTKSTVYYVSSINGNDSFSGTDRERPFATMAQAVTTSAANDIIVFLSGHSETLTATQTIGKTLTLVGEGVASGKPSVNFTMNSAGNLSVLALTTSNIQLRNLYFKSQAQTCNVGNVVVTGTDSATIGCYFEVSGRDTAGLQLGATSDRALVKNCTFISTATASSAVPLNGFLTTSGALSDIELQGCIFDSGQFGYRAFAAQFNTTTRLRADSISLLNGADVLIGSPSTGWFNPQTVTGGSTVLW